MDNLFTHIENAAHSGAFGDNDLPRPSEAECAAGNYKVGRAIFHGLPVAIEQPRGTYRTGKDANGKCWVNRMAAHYGYISGTKGNDGDAVDCFIGFYPQSERVFVINQNIGGRFDEHKVMLGFPDEDSARRAYLDSYDRGWNGLASIVPCSISQLKWWLKRGDTSRPLRDLPPEGLETMTRKVQWNNDAQPLGSTLDQILYQIRCADAGEGLLMDAVTPEEITEDSDGILTFDALVSPYARLERKMELLRGIMERAGDKVKPVAMQITEPFKQRGVAHVAVIFELSDGQTVSIYFHNPDGSPGKMAPTDEVISWKWLLNKKDITIVVAPERGSDLNVREVARRIMHLSEKNSAAFQRVNARRAERMGAIQALKNEISELETELASAQNELEVAKVEVEEAKNRKARDYADAVRKVSTISDAYTRATENGGVDPTTGKTANELMVEIDRESAQVTRLKAIANGEDPGPEGPHKSVLVLQALVADHGWNRMGSDGVVKTFAGLETAGELSPDGSRRVFAGYQFDGERRRYISVSFGGDELFDIDGRDREPADIARELNQRVDAWVASRRAAQSQEGQDGGESDADQLAEAISSKGGANREAVDRWIGRFGEEGARALAQSDYSRMAIFKIIASSISPNRELMDAVNADTGIAAYWSASPESVKALSAEAFAALLESGHEDAGDRSRELAYLVLRHSTKKAELDYVRALGGMKNSARFTTQAAGGKLFKMVQPYLPSQPAPESAEATPDAEQADLSYRSVEGGLFTAFFANTPAGQEAWNTMNATQGSENGKVLASHTDAVVKQLRDAGYTVAEDTSPLPSIEEVAAELEESSRELEERQRELIDAYMTAWSEEAEQIKAAVASVNWDAIVDGETAKAEIERLHAAVNTDRPVEKASAALEAAGIKTWDERLSGLAETDGFRAQGVAIEAYRQAVDRIQAVAKEKLIESGRAALAGLDADTPLVDVARAVFASHGIDAGGGVPAIVQAIEGKDVDWAWGFLRNLENKASADIFERATGIKLAGTQRERRAQLDAWAGITPERRAEIEAQRTERREREKREDSLKWAWRDLEHMNVRVNDGSVKSGQGFLAHIFNQGFKEVVARKRGAATAYYASNGDSFTGLRNKAFNGFMKAALAYGGLRQALELVGGIESPESAGQPGEGEMSDADKIAAVDAAYQFEGATEGFKLWLHSSLNDEEYSPFVTAKAMDTAVKAHGASVDWALAAGAAMDDTGAAVVALEQSLAVLENNEPINRAEGNDEQADLEAHTAASIREAIEELSEDDYSPSEEEMGGTFDPETEVATMDSAEEAGERPVAALLESLRAFLGHSATLDAASSASHVGVIRQDGKVMGRINIAGDGKAMIYVGESGDERVKDSEGQPFMYSEDDAERMVAALLAAKKEPDAAPSAESTGRAKTRADALKVLTDTGMNKWMSEAQSKAVIDGLMGEEWQFFADKMKELAATIASMPKTYDQDGKGEEAIAHLHYFRGSGDWYITEKDMEGVGTEQAFGLADLYGDGGELGYISIQELREAGVELDFHFTPKAVREVRKKPAETAPPAGGEPDEKQVDRSLFQSVIDGTAPNMLAPELADELEIAYLRNQSDPELAALFEQAVIAYQAAMMAATSSLA
ncbi:TPA: hypothetical protein SL531_001349 [Pseudomonas aeruginosa]|nr:hypothetical protein [Pseudomonas aeruginosa]